MIKATATKAIAATKQPTVSALKVDTSYGANLPTTSTKKTTKTLPSTTTPTAAVANSGIDTSYSGNISSLVSPVKTTQTALAQPAQATKIDTSYGANTPSVSPVKTTAVNDLSSRPASAAIAQPSYMQAIKSGLLDIPSIKQPTVKPTLIGGIGGKIGGKILQDTTTPKYSTQSGNNGSGANAETSAATPTETPAVTPSETPAQTPTETPVETGAGQETGNTEAPATTPMTYEEFIAQQNALAQSNLDDTKAYIEQQKQEALHQAQVAQERAVVDAQNSYAQNRATYGANAETLAGMGLSGSGYSDYMQSQAYAQQRADVQAANAQQLAANRAAEQEASRQTLEAQTRYNDFIARNNEKAITHQEEQQRYDEQKALEQSRYDAQQAEKKQGNFAGLLADVNSGNYTTGDIDELAKAYGLDDAQKQTLLNAASKYESEKHNAGNAQVATAIASGEANKDILDAALENDQISQEQYDSNLEKYQRSNFDSYMSYMKSGAMDAVDTHDIDTAYKNGDISEQQYNDLKAEWNSQINTAADAFNDYGSFKEGKAAYDEIMKNPWLSAENKKALETAFTNFQYKSFSSNVDTGLCAKASTCTLNTPDGKKHTVTIFMNNEKDGILEKDSSKNDSKDNSSIFEKDVYKQAGTGQVFIVDGKVYVKLENGTLGQVRDYWGQGAWEALYNQYKGTIYDLGDMPEKEKK